MRTPRRTIISLLLLLALTATGLYAAGAFTHPIPGYSPNPSTQHFVTGSTSNAGAGWVWQSFDVSGARTGEPDKIAYNPANGSYVLVITDHYQFSGLDGAVVAPGDCYVVGTLRNTSGQAVTGAVLTVEDLDRNGQPDLFAYNPATGAVNRIYFRSLGHCDWTDAF